MKIGIAAIGTPDGFQSSGFGIPDDIRIGGKVDLDNSVINILPGTDILMIRRERENGRIYSYIIYYRFAKEIKTSRTGSFYGSALVFENCVPNIKEAATIIDLLSDVANYVQHNCIDTTENRFRKNLKDLRLDLDLTAPLQALGRKNSSAASPKRAGEKCFYFLDENTTYGQFLSNVFQNDFFADYQVIYASGNTAIREEVRLRKALKIEDDRSLTRKRPQTKPFISPDLHEEFSQESPIGGLSNGIPNVLAKYWNSAQPSQKRTPSTEEPGAGPNKVRTLIRLNYYPGDGVQYYGERQTNYYVSEYQMKPDSECNSAGVSGTQSLAESLRGDLQLILTKIPVNSVSLKIYLAGALILLSGTMIVTYLFLGRVVNDLLKNQKQPLYYIGYKNKNSGKEISNGRSSLDKETPETLSRYITNEFKTCITNAGVPETKREIIKEIRRLNNLQYDNEELSADKSTLILPPAESDSDCRETILQNKDFLAFQPDDEKPKVLPVQLDTPPTIVNRTRKSPERTIPETPNTTPQPPAPKTKPKKENVSDKQPASNNSNSENSEPDRLTPNNSKTEPKAETDNKKTEPKAETDNKKKPRSPDKTEKKVKENPRVEEKKPHDEARKKTTIP